MHNPEKSLMQSSTAVDGGGGLDTVPSGMTNGDISTTQSTPSNNNSNSHLHHHHHHHRPPGIEPSTGLPPSVNNECAGCGKCIKDKFLLKSMDKLFHADCLTCNCCSVKLAEVGQSLYFKAGLILCRRDYLRMFGSSGFCSACNKEIQPYEFVMRSAKPNLVFHLNCFSCSLCNYRFCVGDRYYVENTKILCEYDHQERMIFKQMANNGSNLALLRRQVSQTGGGPTDDTQLSSSQVPQTHPHHLLQQQSHLHPQHHHHHHQLPPQPSYSNSLPYHHHNPNHHQHLQQSRQQPPGGHLDLDSSPGQSSQIHDNRMLLDSKTTPRKQFPMANGDDGACGYGSPDSGIRMDAEYN